MVKLSVAFTEKDVARLRSSLRRDRETGCLIWTGHWKERGYGRMTVAGEPWLTHRLAWLFSGRVIPPETPLILHECDNPPCCEVSHLKLGTDNANALDKQRRNRARKSRQGLPRGVAYQERGKVFQACIYSRGIGARPTRYYLGSFDNIAEAAEVAAAARALRELLPHLFAQRPP